MKSISKCVASHCLLLRAPQESDPFAGDIKLLKGPEWKGRFRKRVGDYRIIFTADHSTKLVGISAILLRSERTYR